MTKDEALRLAIESLCCVRDMVGHPDNLEYIDHQVAKIEAALEAKDEPVATKNNDGVTLHLGWDDLPVGTKLYATPPQRTWVGLTDDDRVLIKHDANYNQFMTAGEYAERVQLLTEARLKDKNT